MGRIAYLIAGHISLLLGIIGAFLPILPTTPFILLSAYCYSKGSDKMYRYLLESKLFGAMIQKWQSHGVIPKKAKIISTIMIILLFSYTLIFVPVVLWIKIIVISIGAGVLIFIWTRPSAPPPPTTTT